MSIFCGSVGNPFDGDLQQVADSIEAVDDLAVLVLLHLDLLLLPVATATTTAAALALGRLRVGV
jgi:hypothetical protein